MHSLPIFLRRIVVLMICLMSVWSGVVTADQGFDYAPDMVEVSAAADLPEVEPLDVGAQDPEDSPALTVSLVVPMPFQPEIWLRDVPSDLRSIVPPLASPPPRLI